MYIARCTLHCYNGSSYSVTSEDCIYPHDSSIWSECKPLPNTSEGLCALFFQNQRQRHEQLYIHAWWFCVTLLFYAYLVDDRSKRTLSRRSRRTPSKLEVFTEKTYPRVLRSVRQDFCESTDFKKKKKR